MGKQLHRLIDREPDNKYGTCPTCGRVKLILKNGTYRCSNAVLGSSGKSWHQKKAQPVVIEEPLPVIETPSVISTTPYPHRMLDRNPVAMTGTCAVCGPVTLVKRKERLACSIAEARWAVDAKNRKVSRPLRFANPTLDATKEFFTVREAAVILGVSYTALSSRIIRGMLPVVYHPMTGERVITNAVLLAYMRSLVL